MGRNHGKSELRGDASQPDAGVQSVDRVLDVLEAFLAQHSAMSLASLAHLLNMNKVAVQRLLSTLEARGYVQCSADGKYALGVKVYELGARFQDQLDIRRAAMPEMTSLVEQTSQSAFLCVRDGDYALCLERVEGRHRARIFALGVGERQPLHCGAAPRALLAGLSDAEILAYATRTGLPAMTGETIVTAGELLKDTHRTQVHGYVVSYQDVSPGIAAVGAPIRNQAGQVVASISLSGIATTYTSERIAELGDAVGPAAYRLSRKLGYPGETSATAVKQVRKRLATTAAGRSKSGKH